MVEIVCPDCSAEFEIPEDVIVGEIISCPDCGLDLKVAKLGKGKVEIERVSIEKEDWGE